MENIETNPEAEHISDTLIEVAPNVFQSLEDYEANMKFDEARDEDLLDEVNVNS